MVDDVVPLLRWGVVHIVEGAWHVAYHIVAVVPSVVDGVAWHGVGVAWHVGAVAGGAGGVDGGGVVYVVAGVISVVAFRFLVADVLGYVLKKIDNHIFNNSSHTQITYYYKKNGCHTN